MIEASRDDENYIYYEVKKKDTLYLLSQEFDIPIAEIIGANPELRWGLKAGETIKIPKKDTIVENIPEVHETIDSLSYFSKGSCDSISGYPLQKEIKIALILPFNATTLAKLSQDDTLAFNEGISLIRNTKQVQDIMSFMKACFWHSIH
ncbi:MAG: LysM peptidoglycan-binding domain-containing protein [Bacteroidales bacterium]|nr:LysM peptidoglycan-binding domain-containing protein [Bacteroidales bacterium]